MISGSSSQRSWHPNVGDEMDFGNALFSLGSFRTFSRKECHMRSTRMARHRLSRPARQVSTLRRRTGRVAASACRAGGYDITCVHSERLLDLMLIQNFNAREQCEMRSNMPKTLRLSCHGKSTNSVLFPLVLCILTTGTRLISANVSQFVLWIVT